MTGRATRVSIEIEAAITPMQAAMMVPISIETIASPPLKLPKQTYRLSYILLAIPERSSMPPIKTKSGTAMKPVLVSWA